MLETSNRTSLGTGRGPFVLDDVDDNGHFDLIYAEISDDLTNRGSILWFELQRQTLSLELRQEVTIDGPDSTGYGLFVGDFDGDADKDLAYGLNYGYGDFNWVSVRPLESDQFGQATQLTFDMYEFTGLLVGDFDMDGLDRTCCARSTMESRFN